MKKGFIPHYRSKAFKNSGGFTLIEIIITVAIIMLFSGLSIPRYNAYTQELKLRKESNRVKAVLDLAKKKAVASELYNQACTDFDGYRIVVSAGFFSLNFGCNDSYQTVQDYDLESNISVVTGTGNIDFPPGGFGINITINTIRLKNSQSNQCLDVSITPLGITTVSDSLIGC